MTELPRAATVVLARPSASTLGLEVLLLRRTRAASFMPSAWVFPGGRIDDADHQGLVSEGLVARPAVCAAECGVDVATVRLALAAGVRETREEAAIELDTVLGTDAPAFLLSRWVTPSAESRRFDTLVFLARVPAATVAREDRTETVEHRWVQPSLAVSESARGRLLLMPPTLRTLEELAIVRSAEDLDGWLAARSAGWVVPKLELAPSRTAILLPWHPRYRVTPGEGTPCAVAPRGWLPSAAFELTDGHWSSV